MHGSPEYGIWESMLRRCLNPKHKAFKDYGGRGITVCDRWRDFSAFYADIGPRPSPRHSLERKDGNGNYEPTNCRWATKREQQRNTRRNVRLTFRGETRCLAEWADIMGLKRELVRGRIRLGWDAERALTTPSAAAVRAAGREAGAPEI
jgi:hypothetical protein